MTLIRLSILVMVIAGAGSSATGCAKSAHQTGQYQLERLVPADVLSQVDDTISFSQLHADPRQYVGRTVMVSGVALKARRLTEGTEIEILQVPTERGLSPSDRKAKSEGKLKDVKIWVRRGGPREKEGLDAMRALKEEGFDINVFDRNTPLTDIVDKALLK